MTTLTLGLTKKETQKEYTAKYYAANPEKVKASIAKWKAANSEKVRGDMYKWIAANPEKVKANFAKYYVNHPTVFEIKNMAIMFKISRTQIRELVPQELIELKLLQLTLHRLIQEKRKLK